MAHEPKIPLHPSQLPQQKLAEVIALPDRPINFTFEVSYGDFTENIVPKRGTPRSPIYLAQFEWAETPMNNGVEAFYLEPKKQIWLLWIRTHDDNSTPWKWDWLPVAHCPRKGVDKEVAASHLLLEYWRFAGSVDGSRNTFDWINEEGLLSIANIRAITRELWK